MARENRFTLFGQDTPEETYARIQGEKKAQDTQLAQQNPLGIIMAGIAQSGRATGEALGGLFGLKDPKIKKAEDMQKAMQEAQDYAKGDMGAYYGRLAESFKDLGYTKEAFQALQMGRENAVEERAFRAEQEKYKQDVDFRRRELDLKKRQQDIGERQFNAEMARDLQKLSWKQFIDTYGLEFKDRKLSIMAKEAEADVERARAATIKASRGNFKVGKVNKDDLTTALSFVLNAHPDLGDEDGANAANAAAAAIATAKNSIRNKLGGNYNETQVMSYLTNLVGGYVSDSMRSDAVFDMDSFLEQAMQYEGGVTGEAPPTHLKPGESEVIGDLEWRVLPDGTLQKRRVR